MVSLFPVTSSTRSPIRFLKVSLFIGVPALLIHRDLVVKLEEEDDDDDDLFPSNKIGLTLSKNNRIYGLSSTGIPYGCGTSLLSDPLFLISKGQ